MLPDGMAADLLDPRALEPFRRALPEARTLARLVHGACSCDLVVARHPVSREDEAWLRQRYRASGLSRPEMIRALESHRRAQANPVRPRGHWPAALAGFVVEHARNAGPTLYLLQFAPDGSPPGGPLGDPTTLRVRDVRAGPEDWLGEGRLIRVEPAPPG